VNHIGDTNKMIRDTPRMKAAQMASLEHMTGDVFRVGCDLERELNAANAEIERLTNKVAQLYEGAEETKQRIKRLEETLEAVTDKLDNAWGIYMQFKEAKP
jgi:predicted  nucleic acid-binding Zn-ribbon protein